MRYNSGIKHDPTDVNGCFKNSSKIPEDPRRALSSRSSDFSFWKHRVTGVQERRTVLLYVSRSAGGERDGQCRSGAEKRKRDGCMRDCQLVREEMVTNQ